MIISLNQMEEKYDLLEIIDEDAFGKIYKAKLKNTDELRAIKIIDKKKNDRRM